MLKQKTIAFLAQQQRKQRNMGENQFCMYSARACMQTKTDGYDYCARHVLEDKTAPYRQCLYMSTRTNRRCSKIAKHDRKESYCVEHTRKSILVRPPRPIRRLGPRATPETLLEDLERHQHKESDTMLKLSLTASKPLGLQDFLSEEESDDESRPVEKTLRMDVESDDESIDSDQEDMLKHSGIYTAEEVALITREKLIRLQSLYIDQFKRLQHILREKRRKYLQNARPDREAISVTAARLDPAQKQQYEKLMAWKRYHRSHGVEAILHRRSKERRLSHTEGTRPKEKSLRCLHSDDSVQCQKLALPFIKFCSNHILNDPNQVLFTACRFGEGTCGRPVALAPVGATKDGAPEPICSLHVQLADYVNRIPDHCETMDDETAGLEDVCEEETLATLARTLGDELETPDSSNVQFRPQPDQQIEEAPLDESLLCLDPDGVATLEEAMLDTGLTTNTDELVMMLS